MFNYKSEVTPIYQDTAEKHDQRYQLMEEINQGYIREHGQINLEEQDKRYFGKHGQRYLKKRD